MLLCLIALLPLAGACVKGKGDEKLPVSYDSQSYDHFSVVIDNTGDWIFFLCNASVEASRSSDNGKTWTTLDMTFPSGVSTSGITPRAKMFDDTIFLTYKVAVENVQYEYHLYHLFSDDAGLNWQGGILLNASVYGFVQEPPILQNSGDTWVVGYMEWSDFSRADAVVWRSVDHGNTWIRTLIAGGTYGFSIATDGMGGWLALWVNGRGGDRTVATAKSNDDAASWSDGIITCCQGVTIRTVAGYSNGIWVAGWNFYRGSDSYIVTIYSSDNATTWSAPEAMDLLDSRGSSIRMDVNSDGTWVFVWEAKSSDSDIAMVSSQDGMNWTDTVLVNAGALVEKNITEAQLGFPRHQRNPKLAMNPTSREGIVYFDEYDYDYDYGEDPSYVEFGGAAVVRLVPCLTESPTSAPTFSPTSITSSPTGNTSSPTDHTFSPTLSPLSLSPTPSPLSPTSVPTNGPSTAPSVSPTSLPTDAPTFAPTNKQTESPTDFVLQENTTSSPTTKFTTSGAEKKTWSIVGVVVAAFLVTLR